MKTVLVTGGHGFIGRNVAELLDYNYTMDVLAPASEELDLLSEESVYNYFNDWGIDYVIHCANVGGNRKYPGGPEAADKNITMFSNLSDNLSDVSRMINLGSGAEYGKCQPLYKVSETEFGQVVPTDPYGFSKYEISKRILASEKIVCLRLFGVFGKYEDYEYKFISNAIVKNLFGIPIHIHQNVTFDWLYVTDLVSILTHFLNEAPCKWKDYNVTPPISTDLISIARMINKLTQTPLDIIVDLPHMGLEYSGNNNRLQVKLTHGFCFTPMDEALHSLINYYKTVLPKIDRDVIEKDQYFPRTP